jgi:hypothetical protein
MATDTWRERLTDERARQILNAIVDAGNDAFFASQRAEDSDEDASKKAKAAEVATLRAEVEALAAPDAPLVNIPTKPPMGGVNPPAFPPLPSAPQQMTNTEKVADLLDGCACDSFVAERNCRDSWPDSPGSWCASCQILFFGAELSTIKWERDHWRLKYETLKTSIQETAKTPAE